MEIDPDVTSMSCQDFTVFELVFRGREPELHTFSREFDDLQWSSKYIRRLGPKNVAYYGGSPAELIVLIVSVTANILTVADILTKRLRNGHESTIRVGKREIQFKGSWKAEEIATVIGTLSPKIQEKEVRRKIVGIKSVRTAETLEQLSDLEGMIHKYEELVQGFNEIPKKESWQKTKAQEYQRTLVALQKQAENLRSFILFLGQENRQSER